MPVYNPTTTSVAVKRELDRHPLLKSSFGSSGTITQNPDFLSNFGNASQGISLATYTSASNL